MVSSQHVDNMSLDGIVAWLAVFRVITGIGTGGDYPITVALSAERSTTAFRARQTLGIFSFNSLGSLAARIMLIVLLAGFKTRTEHDSRSFEWVWRLLLGLGTVPLIFTTYARFRIQETLAYTDFVATETSLAKSSGRNLRKQFQDFREYFSEFKHAEVLFATCASWFFYDLASYGIGLNQTLASF